MPAIRQLARVNGVHHNTISRAYGALTKDGWLRRRAGRTLEVLPQEEDAAARDLDGVIDSTIRLARECGYTIDEFRKRLVERLAAEPDHVLVVSTDDGLQALLRFEMSAHLACRIEVCSMDTLRDNPELAKGAVVVCLQGGARFVRPLLPGAAPLLSAKIRDPRDFVALLERLEEGAIIAVVSVSALFLQRAVGLLEPLAGTRHALVDYLLPPGKTTFAREADIVLCDSLAFRRTKSKNAVEYRLLTEDSIREIRSSLPVVSSRKLSPRR